MGASRVLIVDDDPDIVGMLSTMLEFEGYAVETARNGRDALSRARSSRPDVIVLDLMMPIMNGWAFRAEQLRDRELRDIPVVVTTAATEAVADATRLRAQAFFRKPLDFEAFSATVRRLCPPGDEAHG